MGIWIQIAVFSLLLLLLNKVLIRKRKNKSNILLIFGSIFFTMLLVELLLISGIGLTYVEKKSGLYPFEKVKKFHVWEQNSVHVLKSNEFEYFRQTNSLGLSDIEHPINKKSDEFLIMALGDSFTEGDGAHADSTWMKFLEREIGKNDSISYRFFNAGVCGSDPIYQYYLFENRLLKYKPDLVILNIGNDMDDLVYRGGFERFEKNGWVNNRNIELFYATSFIFRLIIHRVMGYNDLIMSKKSYLLKKQNAMNTMTEAITKFDKLAKQKDFQLLIVFYPDKGEVISKKLNYWDKAIQYATDKNIHTLNLLDYYIHQEQINIDNVNYYYWQSDGHHNAKGYEIYGKAVYEKLDELNIVKKN